MKNVVIVGPGRAGTTSLFDLLSKLPSVSPSKFKELHYFSDGVIKYGAKDLSGMLYSDMFSCDAAVTVEATPAYFLASEILPKKILENLSDVKVVCILREPKERIFSLYKHVKNKVLFDKTLTLEQFCNRSVGVGLEAIAQNEDALHYSALYESRYAEHLKNWIEGVGAENVIVLDYEKLNDAKYLYSKLGFMLQGGDASLHFSIQKTNVSRPPRSMALQRMAQAGNERMEPLLRRFPRVKHLLKSGYDRLNTGVGGGTGDDLSVIDEYYESDIEDLRALLIAHEYELPVWMK